MCSVISVYMIRDRRTRRHTDVGAMLRSSNPRFLTTQDAVLRELAEAQEYASSIFRHAIPVAAPEIFVKVLSSEDIARYSNKKIFLSAPEFPKTKRRYKSSIIPLADSAPFFDQNILKIPEGTIAHEYVHAVQDAAGVLVETPKSADPSKAKSLREFLKLPRNVDDASLFARCALQEGAAEFFAAAFAARDIRGLARINPISKQFIPVARASSCRWYKNSNVFQGVAQVFTKSTYGEIRSRINNVVEKTTALGDSEEPHNLVEHQISACYPVGIMIALAIFVHNFYDVKSTLRLLLDENYVFSVLERDTMALGAAASLARDNMLLATP